MEGLNIFINGVQSFWRKYRKICIILIFIIGLIIYFVNYAATHQFEIQYQSEMINQFQEFMDSEAGSFIE